MAVEALVVAQIVRLLRQSPGAVWELLQPSAPARPGDVALRDRDGTVVAVARPARDGSKAPPPPVGRLGPR